MAVKTGWVVLHKTINVLVVHFRCKDKRFAEHDRNRSMRLLQENAQQSIESMDEQ